MVFPVVMYGCESWTIKKAECWRIDAFELWCWRRLLRVPWTARRSNQAILKEISAGSSLEGLMLKLKLQYFGHLIQRVDSLEKTLMLGGIGSRRRRGWQRMSCLGGITDSIGMNLSKLWELVMQKLNNDFLTKPMAYFEAFTLCDFLATHHCWKFLPDVLSTLIFSLSTLAFSKVFSSSQWSKKMKFKRIFLGN